MLRYLRNALLNNDNPLVGESDSRYRAGILLDRVREV